MLKIRILILFSLLIFPTCDYKVEKVRDSSSLELETSNNKIPFAISKYIQNVEPFFEKLGKPQKGDWLSRFNEDGQTFKQFINSSPTLPTDKRRTIYVQPIGEFSSKQIRIINLTVKFIGKFYNLPIKKLKAKKFEKPMSLANKRTNPYTNNLQVRTGYILDEILKPNIPEDAAALISFTNKDLYPEKDFNFVFGQASLKERVGVWSLYRLQKNAEYKIFVND